MDRNQILLIAHAVRRKRLSLAFLMIAMEYYQKSIPDRKVWIKHWIARRKKQGVHHNLFLELQLEEPDKYRRCLRMSSEMFQQLLKKVTPLIQKKNTNLRESVSPAERLQVTLSHIATGESQESLSLTFRLGQSTISGIVRETSAAIYTVLKEEFLQFPTYTDEWRAVANDFSERWNFPNCIGAMDGKHFKIEPPLHSGSLYYCYKDYPSIVLLAVVDAQLRFIFVDIGTNGRISDNGIWNKSDLKTYFENNKIEPASLPGTNEKFPFVVVGDEGFTLTEEVMIPYCKASLSNRKDRKIYSNN